MGRRTRSTFTPRGNGRPPAARPSAVKPTLTAHRYRSMWSMHRADPTFWAALVALLVVVVLLDWVARVWAPGTSPITGWSAVGLLP